MVRVTFFKTNVWNSVAKCVSKIKNVKFFLLTFIHMKNDQYYSKKQSLKFSKYILFQNILCVFKGFLCFFNFMALIKLYSLSYFD
jgi:hypothetical protein